MDRIMKIGKKDFAIGKRAYIMGILNVTPDSFSDGGKHDHLEEAIIHIEKMINEGANIIDIGGESTRPYYTKISDEEEINRVVPVIEEIRKRWDIPISIDTYKSKVAKAACVAGADMINDVWGLQYDKDMAAVVKDVDVAVCLMHNRKDVDYQDFHVDFLQDMSKIIDTAKEAGISDDKIMIDPGIGFAKTLDMNLYLMNNLEILHQFGYPILLGTSRKSMIGKTLDLPIDQRLEGTLATTVMGVMKGSHFIRVHDVLANARAIQMAEAIMRKEKP